MGIRRVFGLACGMFPFLTTEINRVYVQDKPLGSVRDVFLSFADEKYIINLW